MDSDEEEMQKLRNARKGPKRIVKSTKVEEKPQEANPEEDLLTKLNLPTSFGVKKEVPESSNDEPTLPKPPGPQRPGPQRSTGPQKTTTPTPVLNEDKEEEEEEEIIGPRAPVSQSDDNSTFSYEDEENLNFYNIPFSHEAILQGHTRLVSCLSLDPSGSRLLSGSHDCKIKMWDFAGMDTALRSFREIEPNEGSPLKSIQYSNTGDRFLVATANWQAKIYDRDGFPKGECCRGDMYLTDMANTKGHTATLGNAMWSPTEKDNFITCSQDGTVRIWDSTKMETSQKSIIKNKNQQGKKTGVTYCCYSSDGSRVVAACEDGSLQIWPTKGPFSRPATVIRDAHQPGGITSLAFHDDGNTLASRGMDDTLKVWDVRNTTKPLAKFEGLTNFGDTNCTFSPNGHLLMTGTSVKKGEGTGLLVFFDKTTLTRVKQIGIAKQASVICAIWHSKINQIAVGTSAFNIHILYDTILSTNGALLSMKRKPRQKDPNDYEPPRPVLVPNALPLFYETPGQFRRDAIEKYNPKRSAGRIEPPPITEGPGRGGKLGTNLSHILMKHYILKDTSRDQDPREAILKHAQDANENPKWFKAYEATQPNPIFDYTKEPEPRVKPKSAEETFETPAPKKQKK